LVPAFVGLGAPHWDSAARACISGLTRGSSSVHVVRAAVESMAFQSGELLQAMEADAGVKLRTLRVDGGASRNNWLMQFQADLLGAAVERPKMTETTALGAALLAGIGCGLIDAEQGQQLRKIDKRFLPRGSARWRSEQWSGWKKAVRMARTR
jgi:glycerol kinase